MKLEALEVLRCPACGGSLKAASAPRINELRDGELGCAGCKRTWSVVDGIPRLVFPEQLENGDVRALRLWNRVAPVYSWIFGLTNLIRGVRGGEERRTLISRLNLKPGSTVLELAAGSGYNLQIIAQQTGDQAGVFGLDLSPRMLGLAARRLRPLSHPPVLVLGNSAHLPFSDDSFEVVLDGFGSKYYPDNGRAIREMLRVARPGGRIVIAELGVPRDERRTLRQRLLLLWIPGFGEPPPLEAIPVDVEGLKLEWDRHRTAYAIEFQKPNPDAKP